MWVPTNEEIILHVREIPCLRPCGWDQKQFPVISTALRFPESDCSTGYMHRLFSILKARAFPFPFLGISYKKYLLGSFYPSFFLSFYPRF